MALKRTGSEKQNARNLQASSICQESLAPVAVQEIITRSSSSIVMIFYLNARYTGNAENTDPGPRIPTTGRVRGLPTDLSTDNSFGPPLRTIPQNRIKIINKYFSYWLSDRLLVLAKFPMLHALCECNGRAFRLRPKLYHYTLPFPLSWPYSIWKTAKPPGSVREPSEKPRNSPLPVQPILPWVHELVPGFSICSAELQIQA